MMDRFRLRGWRRIVRWLPAVVILLLAASFAWRGLGRASAPDAAAAKPKASGIFRPTKEQWAGLKVAPVKTLSFRSTLVTDGSIALDDDLTTPVFSPYSGRVSRLLARLGDVVRKGAPLMAVESSEVNQGQSDAASARAAYEAARLVEKRQHELYDAGAGALKDWQQSQADLAAADAALKAARGRLRILGKSEAEIDALEKGAGGGVVEAIVAAPVGGTVIQRQVGVGQYIASATGGASAPVYTIADLSTVWLLANVREGDAPALRVGEPAEVSVLALPGQLFKGKVSWVGAAIDPNTHCLPVRVEVRNPEGLLKPQMFATFSIATSEATEAPAVPESALVFEGEKARVFVVGDDGSIAGREVRAGRRRDALVEVTGGLKAGEKIVTSGTLFIDRAVQGE